MVERNWATNPEGIKVRHFQIDPSPDALDPRPMAIYANTEGTVTMVDEMSVSITYTVLAGAFLPFSPVKITAATAELIGLM